MYRRARTAAPSGGGYQPKRWPRSTPLPREFRCEQVKEAVPAVPRDRAANLPTDSPTGQPTDRPCQPTSLTELDYGPIGARPTDWLVRDRATVGNHRAVGPQHRTYRYLVYYVNFGAYLADSLPGKHSCERGKEGRKEGREEGGKEGRKGGREEGRKEGRKEGRPFGLCPHIGRSRDVLQQQQQQQQQRSDQCLWAG